MKEFSPYKERIEEKLEELIPSSSSDYDSLFSAARYSLLAPGKRIRPLLTLLTVEMLEPSLLEGALVPACTLEMIHTYSLIHDDLPSLDGDDYRRGKPTLHRVYNEGHALLVGDYLLTYPFELLAKAPFLTPFQKIQLVEILAEASGSDGMIGGQVMDIEGSSKIEQMHRGKTAALFRAALLFGGVISEASSEKLTLLGDFGTSLGLLFQMVDDILDQDHPEGEEKAREGADRLEKQARDTLSQFPENTGNLEKITTWVYGQIGVPPKQLC
ncbi:MAG: Farnesyl diphosphate synthase [Chlamydiae bacterium]|nr:Farnesyl diphosphate synthase [Chlamydiota bacterium]